MSDPAFTRGRASTWLERLVGPCLALLLVVETIRIDDVGQPLGAALAAVGGLALLVRRPLPLVAFAISMFALHAQSYAHPSFVDASPAFIALFFVATYSLGRWAQGREQVAGLALVAASTAAFVGSELRRADESVQLGADTVVFAAAFCVGPWLAGLVIGSLLNRNRRLEEEQAEVAERAVIEERARIARELHDVVSHAISVTVLQARGARRSLDDDPETAREALDAIEHTNAQALGDMRRLLAVLRDTEADTSHAPQPSLARVGDLVAHFRDAGLRVTLTETGAPADVPPGVDLSAYRIVQESLTNVLRHAPGATTEVALGYGASGLVVRVTNARPTSRSGSSGTGHGLIGIRERVAVVGGEVDARHTSEGGFEVCARLPFAVEPA